MRGKEAPLPGERSHWRCCLSPCSVRTARGPRRRVPTLSPGAPL